MPYHDSFAGHVRGAVDVLVASNKLLASTDARTLDWTVIWMERMSAQADLLNAMKVEASKRVRQALDHTQVETTAMLLKAYLRNINSPLIVEAERKIDKTKLRPDISVWRNRELVAVIECKTQMGWSRSRVAEDFHAREGKLYPLGPKEVFHLVATQCNWTRGDEDEWGKRWLVVSDQPVEWWSLGAPILHRIEPMFAAIGAL